MVQLPFSRDPERLFGREAELKRFTDAVSASREQTHMLLMTGIGGSGKTYLLTRMGQILKKSELPHCPLYDFYHIENFKASSIEGTIIAALDPELRAFGPYLKQRKELDRLREGAADFAEAQKKLRAQFAVCYNMLAQAARGDNRPLVLLFDTAEQAVDLTDPAADVMIPGYQEASWGGEFWLDEMLPLLENTVVVLSGREEGLDRMPVDFYERLKQKLSWEPLAVGAISEAEAENFLKHLLISAQAREGTYQIEGGFAGVIELNPLVLRIWYEVAGGLPFWLSLLLTAQMFGVIPESVEALREKARQGDSEQPQVDWRLSDAQRKVYRDTVVNTLLRNDPNRRADSRLLLLQWMVSLRKGLSPKLLKHLLEKEPIPGLSANDAEQLFTWLEALVIVKGRELPDNQSQKLLFLHDEVYYWLASDESLNDDISRLTIAWQGEQINAVDRKRRELNEKLYAGEAGFTLPFEALREKLGAPLESPALEEQQAERDELAVLTRQRNQIELNQLGYSFQLGFERGMAEYNIIAYTALERSDYGYGITVRQEGLRNIYRVHEQVPDKIVVECAARWILRALYADPKWVATLLPLLRQFCPDPTQASGLHNALLLLAEAQARLYGTDRNLDEIAALLERAMELAEQDQPEDANAPGATWHDFLLAQIYNWRGYHARLRYELDQATQEYRRSLRQVRRQATLPPLFRAITLNNLAYTYAEQGDVETARDYTKRALELFLEAGSGYYTALCHNTIARIEIRAGNPLMALEFANKAVRVLKDRLNSVRGQGLCLPVQAEAWRKFGEELTHDRVSQREAFQRALDLFVAAEERFDTLGINGEERRRELYHQWGCAHRSLARELSHYDRNNPQIAESFTKAERLMQLALTFVESGKLPALMKVDLYEDIAVIRVHRDQYDEELEKLLKQAEDAAPGEYKIRVGGGAPALLNATKGYWRKLAQCQLQRVMQSFGYYEHSKRTDRRFLDAAAKHMVLMYAYLYSYASESWMHTTAERLTLRELRDGYTLDELKQLAHSAFDAAWEYRLDSDALRQVSELIRQAEDDFDLLP